MGLLERVEVASAWAQGAPIRRSIPVIIFSHGLLARFGAYDCSLGRHAPLIVRVGSWCSRLWDADC